MNDLVYPRFRWFVLVAYVIITTSTSLTMIAPAPLVDEIHKAMGADLGKTTAATMMSFSLFMAIFSFAGGFFLDRVGVSLTWIICLVILALGSLLVPVLGYTIPGLVFCRFLHAAGTGPIMASVTALSAQRFKMHERGYVAAFQGFSVCLGIALGFYFSPNIFKILGSWTSTLAWTSVFPAIALVFGFRVLFGPKPPVIQTSETQKESGKRISGNFKKALLYSTAYVLALIGFIDSWCQQTYNAMMPGFYAADIPVGLGLGSMGSTKLIWSSFFMMAGTLVGPILTDKVFKGSPKPAIFIGLSVAALAILSFQKLTPVTINLILVGVPCVVLFFSSFVNPTIFAYVAKHYPVNIAGRLGGFIMFFVVFGSSVGQGISSYMLSKTGFYWSPMLLLAIVTVCGAIAVLFLKPPEGFETG